MYELKKNYAYLSRVMEAIEQDTREASSLLTSAVVGLRQPHPPWPWVEHWHLHVVRSAQYWQGSKLDSGAVWSLPLLLANHCTFVCMPGKSSLWLFPQGYPASPQSGCAYICRIKLAGPHNKSFLVQQRGWGCRSLVEHLPTIFKAVDSTSNIIK